MHIYKFLHSHIDLSRLLCVGPVSFDSRMGSGGWFVQVPLYFMLTDEALNFVHQVDEPWMKWQQTGLLGFQPLIQYASGAYGPLDQKDEQDYAIMVRWNQQRDALIKEWERVSQTKSQA
jgi:hypothetical protein